MTINEYENSQKYDLSKIKINENRNNEDIQSNDEMYICNLCKIQLCPSCCHKHDKKHDLITLNISCN